MNYLAHSLILAALWAITPASGMDFSQDSAYSYLQVLVRDIGPRPMGSPGEQAALSYATQKFRDFGCQSYIMPISLGGGFLTTSGNAIGIVRGKSGRMIVIGGHIDSSGPEIPGANDDGSGTAVVLELARLFGATNPSSTLVFACWGGEESGLVGSQYFVDHFPEIDSVVLMLQVDMANGGRLIGPDPNAPGYSSAPRWLVEAAYEEFHELGFAGLQYDTHVMTLNKLLGGAFGSDHVPFLKKGIPAIDFTTDVSDPIHTPQDNLENFDPSGLTRTGRLLQRLINRFDDGVPAEENEDYYLVQLGRFPLSVTPFALRLFALISLGLGAFVSFRLRSEQPAASPSRIKWSGLKILLLSLVLQSFLWMPEIMIGYMKGVRFPWVNNQTGFYVLSAFSGAVGLWLILRSAADWRISFNGYSLYLRSFAIFFVMIILVSILSPDAAIYPAAGLFLISLAFLVRPVWLKGILLLLSPYMLFRLFFNEAVVLIQRMISQVPDRGSVVSLLYNSGFVLVFGLLALPFLYGAAAVYRSSGKDIFWLRQFARPVGIIVSLIGFAATSVFLLGQSAYDQTWNNFVRAEQKWETGVDSSTVTIASPEFLSLAGLQINGRDTVLGSRVTSLTITDRPVSAGWIAMQIKDSVGFSDGRMHVLHRTLLFNLPRRPYVLNLKLTAVSDSMSESQSNKKKEKKMKWYSFPDSNMVVPVSIEVSEGEKVIQVVEAQYDTLLYPVGVTDKHTSLRKRMNITSRDTVHMTSERASL